MENTIREQVYVFGVKKYDTFKDRQGNEILGGCTVEYGIPYSTESTNKRGYELRKYTFREYKDEIFSLYENIKVPCMAILEAHRENAFSNPVIDKIVPIE